MARRRETLSASVATETLTKLGEIVGEVREQIAVPVHGGIVIDTLMKDATAERVIRAILRAVPTDPSASPDSQPVPLDR
jgi:hypothetical protein